MRNAQTTYQSKLRTSSNQQAQSITKPSLRSAINAKCRECIYCPFTGTGSWRLQVENCTSISCPLYSVRPKSTGCLPESVNGLENPELGHDAPAFNVAGANHAHR
jgi:hypothetical protein